MSTVINTYLSEVNYITTENDDRIATEVLSSVEVASSFTEPYVVSNYGNHEISFDATNTGGTNEDFVIIKTPSGGTAEILYTETVPPGTTVSVTQEFHFDELDEISVTIPTNGTTSLESIVYDRQDNLYIFPGLELDTIVTSEVFEPDLVDVLTASIQVLDIEQNYLFTERVFENHQIVRINPQPLNLVQSDESDNSLSSRSLAPNLTYYNIPDDVEITQSDLRSFEALNILQNSYIPSKDAVFSGEFYSIFYLQNNTSDTFDRINFWVNGGDIINVKNNVSEKSFYEADFYDLNSVVGIENYKNSGPKNSSLFNQVEIQVSTLPKNIVFSSNLTDIETLSYFNSTNLTSLPALNPNDFVGIALKITTKFDINKNINEDYSFMHLNFVNLQDGFYNEYGGQSYSTNNQALSRALPSIALKFVTDYERLVKLIEDTTKELYSNYPPFFREYEDDE